MEVAVFDLDGVLVDVSERLARCLRESNGRRDAVFWNCFLSSKYMYLDKPNRSLIDYVRRLKELGYRIVIVTGRRRDTQYEATIAQLEAFGIPFDEIYMREPGDYRKDHEFKMDIVKKLLSKGYRVVEVWDDSERVVETLKKLLPNTKIVHYRVEV